MKWIGFFLSAALLTFAVAACDGDNTGPADGGDGGVGNDGDVDAGGDDMNLVINRLRFEGTRRRRVFTVVFMTDAEEDGNRRPHQGEQGSDQRHRS